VNALRRRLRSLAWIALLAVWALAVLPAVSRALASAGGAHGWVEVCSAQGSRMVPNSAREAGGWPVPASIGHVDHCPLCVLGADQAPLPPAAGAPAKPVAGACALSPWPGRAARGLSDWAGAQPRAPPALS
jgi:hypothetical protein